MSDKSKNKLTRNFNEKSEKPVKYKKGLKDPEVRQTLQNYTRIAKKDSPHRGKMEEMKKKYSKAAEKRNANHIRRVQNFRSGQEAGLHSEQTLEQFISQERSIDQNLRDKTVKNAKKYYHKNFSTTKKFNTEVKRKKK